MKKKDLLVWGIIGTAAIAAAIYLANQRRLLAEGKRPPRQAPQLDVQHPGDQSEFPAAPQDDREVG